MSLGLCSLLHNTRQEQAVMAGQRHISRRLLRQTRTACPVHDYAGGFFRDHGQDKLRGRDVVTGATLAFSLARASGLLTVSTKLAGEAVNWRP